MSCLNELSLEFVKGTALKASDLNTIVAKINEIIQDICENGGSGTSEEDDVIVKLSPVIDLHNPVSNNAGVFTYGLIFLKPQGKLFENEPFPYIATIYPWGSNSSADKWLGSDYTLDCTSLVYQDIDQDFQLFQDSQGDITIFRTPSTYQVLNDPRRYIINNNGERRYAYTIGQRGHFRLGDYDHYGSTLYGKKLEKYNQALIGEWGDIINYTLAADYYGGAVSLNGVLPILGVFTYGGTKCVENTETDTTGHSTNIKLCLSSTEGEKVTDTFAAVLDYPVYTQEESKLALICGIIPKSYYISVLGVDTSDENITPGNISTVVEDMLLNEYDPRIAFINQKMNEDYLKSVILYGFGGRAAFVNEDFGEDEMYYRFEGEDAPTVHKMYDIFVEIAAPLIEDCFGYIMPWEEDATGWEYTEEDGKINFTGTKWFDKSQRQVVKDRILGTNKSYIKYGSDWANGANKGVRKAVHDMYNANAWGSYESEARYNYLIQTIKRLCPTISLSATSRSIETSQNDCLCSVKNLKVAIAYEIQKGEEYPIGVPTYYDMYIYNVQSRWINMLTESITDLPLLGQSYTINEGTSYGRGLFRIQHLNTASGTLHEGDLLVCLSNRNSINAAIVADTWLNDFGGVRGNDNHVVLGGGFGGEDGTTLNGLGNYNGVIKNLNTTISYQESIQDTYGIGVGTIQRYGGDYSVGTFRANEDIEVSEIRFNSLHTWNAGIYDTPYAQSSNVYYSGESIRTYYGIIGRKTDWY